MYYFLKTIKVLIVIGTVYAIYLMFVSGHFLGGTITMAIVLLLEFGDRLPKTWYENIFNKDKE